MEFGEFLTMLEMDTHGMAKKTDPETPEHPPLPSPSSAPEEGTLPSLRDVIEGMLADGPRPYSEILEACGGNEDTLRETIRGWSELVAFDDKGTWTWGIRKSRFDLRGPTEKVGKARQTPSGLFRKGTKS